MLLFFLVVSTLIRVVPLDNLATGRIRDAVTILNEKQVRMYKGDHCWPDEKNPLCACIKRSYRMKKLLILCLGDSITEGTCSEARGGYRGPLQELLKKAGVKFDFVGRNKTKGMADGEHEGQSGRRLEKLKEGELTKIIKANPNPDIVLLLLGINDLIENRNTVEQTLSRMNSLLDRLAGTWPKSRIFVGNLIPNASDNPVKDYKPSKNYHGSEQKVLEFNKHLAKLVGSKKRSGMKITLVDLHKRLSKEDLCDGIHPNRQGYEKIARCWFEAITAEASSARRRKCR